MVVRELINLIGFDVDETSMRVAEAKFRELSHKFARTGAELSAVITAPVALFAHASIKAAQESISVARQFQGIFGNSAGDAKEFAEVLAKSTGSVVDEVEKGLSSFAAQADAFGFSKEKGLALSKQMQAMAIDFGAFYGVPMEEAQQQLMMGLVGSGRELRRYGFNLKEATVAEEMQRMGLRSSNKAQEESNKMLARANLLMQQMTHRGVMGQGIKTLKEFGGQSRQFNASMHELQESIGKMLLPVLTKILVPINSLLNYLNSLSPQVKGLIMVVVGLTAAVGPLLLAISGVIALFSLLNLEMLPWIALIVAIGAAIYLLVDDFNAWKAGGESVFGYLFGSFDTFMVKVKSVVAFMQENLLPVWESLKDTLSSIFTILAGVIQIIKGLLTGDFSSIGKGLLNIFSGIYNVVYGIYNVIHGLINSLLQLAGMGLGKIAHLPFLENLQKGMTEVGGTGWANPSEIAMGVMGRDNSPAVSSSYKSNVNLTFPAGMSEEHISAAQQGIRQVWFEEMGKQSQQVFSLFPVTQ